MFVCCDVMPTLTAMLMACVWQRKDLARIVGWVLGQVESVKLEMNPFKPPSAAILPLNVAHALQWRLATLYARGPSVCLCVCARLYDLASAFASRYNYVAVMEDVEWRLKLVVLVQETNAQLHQLVRAASTPPSPKPLL